MGRDDRDNSKKNLPQTLKNLIIPSGKVKEEFSREFAVIGNTKALKELNKSIRKRNKKK
ncbi:MAG: hypothetical protein ABWX61_04870 [Paenisporosarcina sp.]